MTTVNALLAGDDILSSNLVFLWQVINEKIYMIYMPFVADALFHKVS